MPSAARSSRRARAIIFALGVLAVTRTVSFAAEARPGLLSIVYADAGLTRVDSALTLSRLDHQIPEWPEMGDWGLRALGRLQIPVTGRVLFQVETNQRVRLWLNGRPLLDVGHEGGSAAVDCVAGESIPIVLEYEQSNKPGTLRVLWTLPGRAIEPIPAAALSHDRSDQAVVEAAGMAPRGELLLEVANPEPARLPSLRVLRDREQLLLEAKIPSVPGFTCHSWCYEGGMEYVDSRDLGGGRLELRHRLTATPEVLVMTEVTPELHGINLLARLEREDGAKGPLPESAATPNLCWQLKASPAFASKPDPYPAFFSRCFIFTERGQVFLDQTVRRKIPAQPEDDRRNNPPWVQIYGPAWEPPQRSEPGAWADYSSDRFACSVVGTVSRDRKYLAAIASSSAGSLCQAWHDCMHINSRWSRGDRPTWRLKIYAMENDPEALLAAVRKDFPDLKVQLNP